MKGDSKGAIDLTKNKTMEKSSTSTFATISCQELVKPGAFTIEQVPPQRLDSAENAAAKHFSLDRDTHHRLLQVLNIEFYVIRILLILSIMNSPLVIYIPFVSV